MWSASSMTVISTASSETWPWPMRSSSRPGQATTTSTPRRIAETWGPWPTPPKTVREVRPRRCASGVIASSIWATSSRVGARIRARGRLGCGRRWPAASRVSSGSTKAIVLPEPVRPRPSTSRPASESGSVAAWMGVGVVMPRAASTSTRGAGTPSVPKFWEDKEVPSWCTGSSDRCGRRRHGMFCRAGLWAAAPRDGRCSRREGIDIKETRPEAEGGPARSSLRDGIHISRIAVGRTGVGCSGGCRGDHLSTRLRGRDLPPTVAYAVAPALPARHRAVPRRPPAAAALRAALPRARAEPGRARRGRPAVRGEPHPQGSRGGPRRGAGPPRNRVRGKGRRDGARRERDGHHGAPRRDRGAALPPRRCRRRGRHRLHDRPRDVAPRALRPTTRQSRTSRRGPCASTPATSPVSASTPTRSRRRPVSWRTGSRSGWRSTPWTANGCSTAPTPPPGCAPCSPCSGARRRSSNGSAPCRRLPARVGPR